jgi:hypothetical protein
MSRHQVGDLVIASDILLPEAPRAEPREAECRFHLHSARHPVDMTRDWFHRWAPESGETALSFAKLQGGYLLRFHRLADFEISTDGAAIDCQPLPGVPAVTLRHLLLDQVAPLVMSLRGRLVLHASAVSTPRGAVAFVGDSGQGKSTLAANLACRGFPVIADDCLLLGEDTDCSVVVPSYPGLRLWPDAVARLFGKGSERSAVAHYSDKKRVLVGKSDTNSDRVPLWRLFLFPSTGSADPTGIEIERLVGSDALVEIVKRAYVLDVTDRATIARVFERISKVVARTTVYRLNYPYDFALLPRIGNAVTGKSDPVDQAVDPL